MSDPMINPRRNASMSTEFADIAERWVEALPAALVRETIGAARVVRLHANDAPWHGTGIRVNAGQAYSLFANGRVQWSLRDPTLYGGPRQHLCARIAPGGRVVNPTGDTGTFVADVDGELELGIYMGLWKNALGDLATSESLYRRLSGGIDVLAIGWCGDPANALATLDDGGLQPPFISREIARLRAPRSPPADWNYLLETGTAGIFTDAVGASGERVIALDSRDDQGIVCSPIGCELNPGTRLSWRWRVTEVPSAVAEDRPQTHDYISIATEFDNGRDLTWIWSSRLTPETHFDCPIHGWTARETHWVVRSGNERLGQWCAEERHVYADVLAAMGTPPARIVRVWLIAVSSFQHGTAQAEFADIVLSDGSQTFRVL